MVQASVPRVVPGRVAPTRVQRTTRVLKWVASMTAVLILLGAGGAWWAFRHYDGQIGRVAIPGLEGVRKPAAPSAGGQTFLLVGSDDRAGANAEGTGFVPGERSDTVILIHLFGTSRKVELVSFPRDSWVEIPEHKDPKTGRTQPARFSKLNSAFSQGGPALLIATLEHLTKLRIDHYLRVDFVGFKRMVNEVGGVDVCLTARAKDRLSGIDLSAGRHHISGDVALAFVRQRHGLARGDIDRIARQQQFIASLANKVLSKGTLLDPFKLTGFLDAATESLQVDEELSTGDLKELAMRLRHFRSKEVLFITVPITTANARRQGQSVVLIDDAAAARLFEELRTERTPQPTATKPPSGPSPSQVRVAVFNGSGVAGLGRKAADALQAKGFKVEGAPATRGTGATDSVIRYGAGGEAAAKTLQSAVPGAKLVSDATLSGTLELVLGSSYAKPPAKPGTKPAAPVKTAQDDVCTR